MAHPNVREAFTIFFQGWLIKHQEFLEQLQALSVSTNIVNKDAKCRDMVAQVLAHYHEYYQEKNKVASEDVFLVLSPPWFSSFERTLLWISGFKPSMVFPLIKNCLGEELSGEQLEKIEMIRADTRRVEKEVEGELAGVQESVAAPAIFDMVRRSGGLVDGEVSELDEAIEELKQAILVVMENAEGLRGSTVRKVVEILSPLQNVKFLAAAAQFMLQARSWGMHKDSQSSTTGDSA